MFDKGVGFFAGFDVIGPVLDFTRRIANGGGHMFIVAADCGYSTGDINKKLLKPKGIKSWGYKRVDSDTVVFTTRKQDAPQAQSILVANGITPESPAPKGYKQDGGKGKQSYQPGKGWGLFG